MEELNVVKTGIPFLDSLLGGGFMGHVVTISQMPGVKFREFIHRILCNNYSEKFHLVLVTFHLCLQEYMDLVKYSAKNPESFEELNKIFSPDKISIIDCFSLHDRDADSKEENIHYVSNPFNVDSLLYTMTSVRENIPPDRQVYWYFPDITNMNIGVSEDTLVKFCRKAFHYHKQKKDFAIYVLNGKVHTEKFFAKLYQLADVYLRLVAKETSWGLENSIQLIKTPLRIHSQKVFYDVKENMEIQFRNDELKSSSQMLLTDNFPELNALQSRKPRIHSELTGTKIPLFDFILGGGFPPNSVVVSSYQQGIMIAEPFIYLFYNKLNGKNHVIIFNYPFSANHLVTYLKILQKRLEGRGLTLGCLDGNTTIIDCLNNQQDKINIPNINVYAVSNPFDIEKLLSIMTDIRNKIPEDNQVFWVFYSLTEMSIGVPEDELIMFCRRAFRYHKWCKDMALYILNEQAHTEPFLAKLYQLSDVYIKFIAEDTNTGKATIIQILKSPLNYNSTKVKLPMDEKGQIRFKS
ncbi:MAG: hypothetical protein QXO71_00340 [Candidatus Jordarchaeaceae archaeon]